MTVCFSESPANFFALELPTALTCSALCKFKDLTGGIICLPYATGGIICLVYTTGGHNMPGIYHRGFPRPDLSPTHLVKRGFPQLAFKLVLCIYMHSTRHPPTWQSPPWATFRLGARCHTPRNRPTHRHRSPRPPQPRQ